MYDPQTARYTRPDPIGLSGGMNRYVYVGGNALWAVDERGEQAVVPGPAGIPMPVPLPPPPGKPIDPIDIETGTRYPITTLPEVDLPSKVDVVKQICVFQPWLCVVLTCPEILENSVIIEARGKGGRGERGATGGSSGKGTSNPYKHCRDNPNDPKTILCKDHQTGKWVKKPKPADW